MVGWINNCKLVTLAHPNKTPVEQANNDEELEGVEGEINPVCPLACCCRRLLVIMT